MPRGENLPIRALGTVVTVVAHITGNASGGRHGEPSILWRLSDFCGHEKMTGVADFDLLAPILPFLKDGNEMHPAS